MPGEGSQRKYEHTDGSLHHPRRTLNLFQHGRAVRSDYPTDLIEKVL